MKRTLVCSGALCLLLSIFVSCKVQTGTSYLFKDQTFNFEAKRVLQYAVDRGVDINEVLQTIARIKDKDTESWHEEWMSTAVSIDSLATFGLYDSLDRAYMFARAHNYYRAAEFFLLANDIRKTEVYNKSCSAFYKSLDLENVEYIKQNIPYEGSSLSGVFFPGREIARDKPLIVIVNG